VTVAGPPRERSHLPSWVAAAVGVVTLAVALSVVSPYVVGAFQDDGIYVILGRALATGAGYRYLHLPGMPNATHYPPAYPALLAVLWRFAPQFPANVLIFERANAVLLAVSAILGFELARRCARLPTLWSAAVALGGTVTILPLTLATMVLSESLFLAVLLAALLAAEHLAAGAWSGADGPGERPSVWRQSIWREVASGVAVGALCALVALVRSVGVVLVPAAFAVCLWRGRRRAGLALAIGAAAVLMPWQLWVWGHTQELAPVLQGKYGSYSGWVTGALQRHGLGFATATLVHNSGDLAATLGLQLAARLPAGVKWLAVALCAGLLAVGAARLTRRSPVVVAFSALYAAEVLLWPFPPFRFIWAVWLLLILTLASGASAIIDWQPTAPSARVARLAALVVAVLLGVGLTRYNVLGYRHAWWDTMRSSLSAQTARPLAWLAAHPTLPGPTMSDVEPTLYLYAARPGLPCSAFTPDEYVYARDTSHDRAALAATLRRFPVGSIIATEPVCALAALRLAASTPQSLVPVDTVGAGLAVFVRTP
jgi:hypothetical protein